MNLKATSETGVKGVFEVLGEYVDRIVNSKLTPHLLSHEAATFYSLARAAQGGKALTQMAAGALKERVGEGDYVFILHNAGLPYYLPYGETDGPLGAASLARALIWALGARPVFIGPPGFQKPIEQCAMALGMRIVDRETVERYKVYYAAQVIDFPLGPHGAAERSAQLLEDYQPRAILAVESLGPNAMDRFHTGVGYPIPTATQAHLHLIVDKAEKKGTLTIGFGDGGNELGYGLIADAVNEWKAKVLGGQSCQCGCGGGTATRVRTSVLVSAATSNWGSYGVSALLAYLTKNLEAFHDEGMEFRMLEAAVMAGAVDAVSGSLIMAVDGTSARANQAIVTLLREIVQNSTREFRSRLYPNLKEVFGFS
jgi:hypothetical protein